MISAAAAFMRVDSKQGSNQRKKYEHFVDTQAMPTTDEEVNVLMRKRASARADDPVGKKNSTNKPGRQIGDMESHFLLG